MSVFRVAINFPHDSALPRDEMSITPHYIGDNAQALANALKSNLTAYAPVGATHPFKIKVYDAEKAPPSYPLATAEQAGTPSTSATPREICLCLSYYGQFNRPSYRGRLYLPELLFGGAQGIRPTQAQRDAALAFANVLTQGLPSGHHWVIYSRKNKTAFNVTNTWVDDEWDVQRSRGLRGTTRTLGTVA